MNYTIVVGTHRINSNSEKVANYYQNKLLLKNIDSTIIKLRDLPSDFVFSDTFGKRSNAFNYFQNIVSQTNKFIFIIPEYNGSFPGVLKAFIDACDFPNSFLEKKACLVGLSSGQFGNLRGLEHFTGVANYVKMNVHYNKMYLAGVQKDLEENGEINNPFLIDLIDNQITAFIEF